VGLALAGPLAASAGSNEALVEHVTSDHLLGLGGGSTLAVVAVVLALRAAASHR
jgi:ribose 5-phosphate isomerase